MCGMETSVTKRRIEVYDTTLRDGAQAEGISFSLQDKLLITRRLIDLEFDFIEGGYPGSNAKDSQYFEHVRELDRGKTRICAFGMTRRKGVSVEKDGGLRKLADSSLGWVALVGKASAFHVTEVLRTSLEENLAMIADSVRYLSDHGQEVIFDAEHFFDGWRANRDYTRQVIETAAEAGARIVVLCDTNGGCMPEQIGEVTREVVSRVPVPVGIHCHNDCDLAVANTLAAVDAGASIANLDVKTPCYEVLGDERAKHLTDLSRYVYEMVNLNFRANQPFVGRSAFAHKGGMHVSGVSRNTASYEHVDPARVGNERRVLLSELSGRANVIALTQRLNIQPDSQLMDEILSEVVSKENEGYQFEAADGTFNLLVKKCMGTFRPHFDTLHYHVNVDNKAGGEVTSEAVVKIRVEDDVRFEAAEGHGPVDALDAALRKALNGRFPALNNLHLVDYKVRVIDSKAATAAWVRVVIESQDEDEVWGTVGVSENIIEASWIALIDSYEYKLGKDEERKQQAAAEGD